MSDIKNRVDTIKTLLQSSVIPNKAQNQICSEFDKLLCVKEVSNIRRRRLLKVLHSTRGLDSTLKNILDCRGIRHKQTLGSYLHALKNASIGTPLSSLTQAEVSHYLTTIVHPRNLYMHEADQYPQNETEINELLREMEACLTRVLML